MRWPGSCLLVLLATGCEAVRDPVPPLPAERSLAQQIAAVRAGDEGTILVEQTPLVDEDLRHVTGLASLTALCIDHDGSRISAAGIGNLSELPRLTHLRIRGSGIDDEALATIAKLQRLTILNVPRGEFTADGLEHLVALPELEMFRFHSPHIADADLALLGKFPNLRRLHLIDVAITDAGLADLAKIDRLQSLYIDGGQISDAAWDELFRRRPDLHVHIDQQHHDRDPQRHPH
jgi:hypothetical protein